MQEKLENTKSEGNSSLSRRNPGIYEQLLESKNSDFAVLSLACRVYLENMESLAWGL